jgi:hypothetical protein
MQVLQKRARSGFGTRAPELFRVSKTLAIQGFM